MRHMLIIKPRSAKLACGPAIDAYFPMESRALNPSGIGKIDVTTRRENVTCTRCAYQMGFVPKDDESPTAPAYQ